MDDVSAHDPLPERQRLLRSPRRLLLAALGLLCVGLGLVGIVVPGLPTTIFLLAASYLFARSCPVLEERLIRSRVFRPYARYLDGSVPFPPRARWSALALMWLAVLSSAWLLDSRQQLPPWLGLTLAVAALAGTVAILRFRREPVPASLDGQHGSAANRARTSTNRTR